LCRDVERCDKPEREFSASKIVVNRFRNAANGNVAFVDLRGYPECPLAAQHYEGIDSQDAHVADRFLVDLSYGDLLPVFGAFGKVTAVTRPEDSSAAWKQAAHISG